jgi:hypothetical protein
MIHADAGAPENEAPEALLDSGIQLLSLKPEL